MKFYWQEIFGQEAVAKLNTMVMGCCNILHLFFYGGLSPHFFLNKRDQLEFIFLFSSPHLTSPGFFSTLAIV